MDYEETRTERLWKQFKYWDNKAKREFRLWRESQIPFEYGENNRSNFWGSGPTAYHRKLFAKANRLYRAYERSRQQDFRDAYKRDRDRRRWERWGKRKRLEWILR